MSYFPTDIPFMSDEEMRENGIRIPGDVSDTNVGNIEYISKQNASDWLKQYGQDVLHGKYKFSLMYIWKNIMVLPAADVVPVVRCKDCKHYYFADNRIPQEQRYVCEISGEIWKPDSFCSYGERREE